MTRTFIHYILVAGQSGQARQLVSSLTNYKVKQSLFFHLRGLYYYYQDNLRINPGLSLLKKGGSLLIGVPKRLILFIWTCRFCNRVNCCPPVFKNFTTSDQDFKKISVLKRLLRDCSNIRKNTVGRVVEYNESKEGILSHIWSSWRN